MSGGLGIPRIDFTPLSELGKSAALGLQENQTRQAIQGLGVAPGSPDFLPKLGQVLISQGDVNGATAVARLISADQDRAFQRQTSERDFGFRQTEAQRAQSNADRSFGLQSDSTKYDQIYRDRTDKRADRQLSLQEQALTRKEYPEGFQPDPANPGALRPIPGASRDPVYIGAVKAAEEAAKGQGGGANPYASGSDKFNEAQGKSAAFADRMFQTEDLIRKQEAVGANRVQQGLARLPFGAGSYANSDEFKSYKAAKDNWITAQLRKESGAAIGQAEYDAADKQYFPQPGDPVSVIEQKRQLRRTAIEGMAREGGGSYAPKMTFGEDGALKPYTPPQRGVAPAQAPAGNAVNSLDAIPEGKRFRAPDGKIYRKTNGQAVPE
jgi:hypothetical protein